MDESYLVKFFNKDTGNFISLVQFFINSNKKNIKDHIDKYIDNYLSGFNIKFDLFKTNKVMLEVKIADGFTLQKEIEIDDAQKLMIEEAGK